MAIFTGKTVRNTSVTALGFALVTTVASALDRRSSSNTHVAKHITVTTPSLDPTIASGCVAEAAAYAEALVDLEDAQAAADAAYDAYYNCTMQNMTPQPVDMSQIPSQSVLIRD